MKKIKILALFGKSASGKDTIQKWIVSNFPRTFNGIVSCTTRPPRDGEQDGVAYHFLTNEEFTAKVLNGDMLEATDFRGWFYGTSISELNEQKINVGVFNVAGIECLLEDSRLDVFPVFVCATDKTRLLRSLNREPNPDCKEICRRFGTDKKDFENIDFDYEAWLNESEGHDEYDYKFRQLEYLLDTWAPPGLTKLIV